MNKFFIGLFALATISPVFAEFNFVPFSLEANGAYESIQLNCFERNSSNDCTELELKRIIPDDFIKYSHRYSNFMQLREANNYQYTIADYLSPAYLSGKNEVDCFKDAVNSLKAIRPKINTLPGGNITADAIREDKIACAVYLVCPLMDLVSSPLQLVNYMGAAVNKKILRANKIRNTLETISKYISPVTSERLDSLYALSSGIDYSGESRGDVVAYSKITNSMFDAVNKCKGK